MSEVSESKVRALAYIERIWWEQGEVPTNERIADVLGLQTKTVENWMRSDNFQEALKKRGVALDAEENPEVLSLDQLNAANMLMNTYDKRTLREKCEELGVSTQKLNSWMRDPRFVKHLRIRAEGKFNDADTAARLSMIKNIEAGDMSAIKLFFEMTGQYTPKIKLDVDVHAVLNNIVEIIQVHVKDPLILEKIAADIEALPGVGGPKNTALQQHSQELSKGLPAGPPLLEVQAKSEAPL